MGLHVGGIHVETSSADAVITAIRDYWTKLGARVAVLDPLDFEPLKLEETGRLGFVVSKVIDGWVAIYDSQRYTADPALARALSSELATDVWFYEITGSTDHAYAKKYGAKEEVLRGEEDVLGIIGPLPHALLYYNQIRQSPDVLSDFTVLGFEGIPHRPQAKYTGPSPETKRSIARADDAQRLADDLDAEALIPLAKEHRVMWEVLKPKVERVDLRDARACAFVYKLADTLLAHDGHNRYVAEACLRSGDRARFEAAMTNLVDYQASLAARRAHELLQASEPDLAFAMFEQISRSASAQPDVFNNALYALFKTDNHDLPPARLDALFARATEVGRANPPIFHNLACVLVKLGRLEAAIAAVAGAVTWGYEYLDKLRDDTDLGPLHGDPRFVAAFQPPESIELADIVVRSAKGERPIVTIAPVVLLSLFFEDRARAVNPIADLLARLAAELPADTFQHYMWGSHSISWSPIHKGKLARDSTKVRKVDPNSTALRWGSHDGEPLGWRVSVDLDANEGEVDLMFPLADAQDPDALAARLASYAQMVPFACGAAGYALGVYEEGPVVGPGTYAHGQLAGMRQRYLGLGASQQESEVKLWTPSKACSPGWLTFLGPALVSALGPNLEARLAPARATNLGNGLCVRAAAAPFIGLASAPRDLGALPAVARALAPVRIEIPAEAARLATIAALAVPPELALSPVVPPHRPLPRATKAKTSAASSARKKPPATAAKKAASTKKRGNG